MEDYQKQLMDELLGTAEGAARLKKAIGERLSAEGKRTIVMKGPGRSHIGSGFSARDEAIADAIESIEIGPVEGVMFLRATTKDGLSVWRELTPVEVLEVWLGSRDSERDVLDAVETKGSEYRVILTSGELCNKHAQDLIDHLNSYRPKKTPCSGEASEVLN